MCYLYKRGEGPWEAGCLSVIRGDVVGKGTCNVDSLILKTQRYSQMPCIIYLYLVNIAWIIRTVKQGTEWKPMWEWLTHVSSNSLKSLGDRELCISGRLYCFSHWTVMSLKLVLYSRHYRLFFVRNKKSSFINYFILLRQPYIFLSQMRKTQDRDVKEFTKIIQPLSD